MKATRRAKHFKFGYRQKFCTLFSIAMARCIRNFCHNIVHSIRNTILKLCADCVKPFVGNAQSCGKTIEKLKTSTKGKRFARIEELKEKSKLELLALPKSAFQKSVFRGLHCKQHQYRGSLVSNLLIYQKGGRGPNCISSNSKKINTEKYQQALRVNKPLVEIELTTLTLIVQPFTHLTTRALNLGSKNFRIPKSATILNTDRNQQ